MTTQQKQIEQWQAIFLQDWNFGNDINFLWIVWRIATFVDSSRTTILFYNHYPLLNCLLQWNALYSDYRAMNFTF